MTIPWQSRSRHHLMVVFRVTGENEQIPSVRVDMRARNLSKFPIQIRRTTISGDDYRGGKVEEIILKPGSTTLVYSGPLPQCSTAVSAEVAGLRAVEYDLSFEKPLEGPHEYLVRALWSDGP
jgi:hypothetical protein